jgi:hypothetical protein
MINDTIYNDNNKSNNTDIVIIDVMEAENVTYRPSCFCLYNTDTIVSINQCGCLILLVLVFYLLYFL